MVATKSQNELDEVTEARKMLTGWKNKLIGLIVESSAAYEIESRREDQAHRARLSTAKRDLLRDLDDYAENYQELKKLNKTGKLSASLRERLEIRKSL